MFLVCRVRYGRQPLRNLLENIVKRAEGRERGRKTDDRRKPERENGGSGERVKRRDRETEGRGQKRRRSETR